MKGDFFVFNSSKMDFQIDDFMTNCEAKDLREKTMRSYEQTLRLFAKFLNNNFHVTDASVVKDSMVKAYIEFLKDRGKYTEISDVKTIQCNNPNKRADYGTKISVTTINNYIRNIKVFFSYLEETD